MRRKVAVGALACVSLWLAACGPKDNVLSPDPVQDMDPSAVPDGDTPAGDDDGVVPDDNGDSEGADDGTADPSDDADAPDGMADEGQTDEGQTDDGDTPDDSANDTDSTTDMTDDVADADDVDGAEGDEGSDDGGSAKDADCDMNGIWIGRQITVSSAGIAGDQFANNWYYLELKHEGEVVTVTKHFDCGIKVMGTATVQLSKATLVALMEHNIQTGRKGKAYKEGTSCHFEMERFWSIRGADEERFIPDPRNVDKTVKALGQELPLPTAMMTDGAEDWENDNKLGSAWQVSGLVTGTRNTIQRDWTEYFSDAKHAIMPATDWPSELKVRAKFDAAEVMLDPTSGLLASGSTPAGTAEHNLTLKFLGRSASDTRATNIVKPQAVDTCFAIQAALPARKGL